MSQFKHGKFSAEDFLNSISFFAISDSDDKYETIIENDISGLDVQHKKIMKKFSIDNLDFIDAGTYGEVYTGRAIKNGRVTDEKIAVKMLKAHSLQRSVLKNWKRMCQREMYYIHQFKDHENIVNIFDYLWLYNPEENWHPAYIAIKFEHLEINLDKCISDGFKFNFEIIGNIARQIGSAIEFIHEKQLAHHDIKPHNIMISKLDVDDKKQINNQTVFKLIDFGLARQVEEKVGTRWLDNQPAGGTLLYLCKEMFPNYGGFGFYNPYLVDSFAFGATLLHILMGNSFVSNSQTMFADGVYQQFLIDTWARSDLATYLTHPHYLKAIGNLLRQQNKRQFVFQVLPMFQNDTTSSIEEHFVQPTSGWPTPGESSSRLCRSFY